MEKTGKILLINSRTKKPCRPAGLEYAAEFLSAAGYEQRLLDLTVEEEPDRAVLEAVTGNDYEAIGVSIFNYQWDTGRDRVDFFLPEIRGMVRRIQEKTCAPVILGGHSFSLQAKDILDYVGGDYGVAGSAIPVLGVLLERIKGGLEKGTVVSDNKGNYLGIPFRRDLVDQKKYPPGQTVYISAKDGQGCAEHCYHCQVKGKMRLRDPAAIAGEIRSLVELGCTRFQFTDDMFNVPERHAAAICEHLTRFSVQWSAYIYPWRKHLSPELLDLMKRSGMTHADEIGSRNTGSARMIEAYNQRYTREDLEFTTKEFTKRGMKAYWFLGFGAPGEDRETIDETFELIDRSKPDGVAIVTRARIYRGTLLAGLAEREGRIRPGDPLLEPTYYPFADEFRDHIWEEAVKRPNCTVFY